MAPSIRRHPSAAVARAPRSVFRLEQLEGREVPAATLLPDGTVMLDNGVNPQNDGYVSATFGSGGTVSPSGGGGSSFTNQGATQRFVQSPFTFDQINFVDVHPDATGGVFALSDQQAAPTFNAGPTDNNITTPVTVENGAAVSRGSFMGPNGLINWEVVNSIADGSQNVINRVTFTSAAAFGDVRFINYYDGIIGAESDLLRVTGPGANGLDLLSITPNDGVGATQRGPTAGGATLQGASFEGFAAFPFAGSSVPAVRGEQLNYLPQPVVAPFAQGGNIDPQFPATNDPDFGPVFGTPNANSVIVTAIAYLLDPNATSATIQTNFGFVQDVNADLTVPSPADFFATGAGAGSAPLVNLFNPDGTPRGPILPYDPTFSGGVRVAVADVTGDGTDDLITAPGPGMIGLVKVFDGTTGALALQFLPFLPVFTGGVFVSAGDFDGDGRAEVVCSTSSLGGPAVVVFDPVANVAESAFFAYPSVLLSGVRTAVGDVTGDGQLDIVTVPGPGAPANVKVYTPQGVEQRSFFGLPESFLAGAFVTAADTDGDGAAEIAVAPDNFNDFSGSLLFDLLTGAATVDGGGIGQLADPTAANFALGPLVRVFDSFGALQQQFFAFDPSFLGGVRLGAADLNGDGRDELLAAAGDGGPPLVTTFAADPTGQLAAAGPPILAFDPSFLGGVYVAG